MTALELVIPPAAGAAIGWVTNWAAIKLLFRPLSPVTVLGIRLQGVIPKRRKEIARSIATAIENELLSSSDIASMLTGVEWRKEVEKTVEEMIEHRFGRLSKIPVVGLVTDNVKSHVRYLVTREIFKHLDDRKESIAARLRENIRIRDAVVERIDKFDLKRFEGLLTAFIARELKFLEYLGGVMGFAIGLLQSAFLYFNSAWLH